MSDLQFFLKWLSDNACLSIVLVWLLMEGLVGVAKACRPTKDAPDLGDSPAKSESTVINPKRVI